MPPQRGGRPANQTVANNYQQVIVPGRRNTVQCLHCHRQMIKEASRQQSHLNQCNSYQTRFINRPRELKKRLRYTQSVEVDEEKLCEMEDRLLQEEIAMTRLSPSNEDTLNEYLDSIIDGQVLLKLPLQKGSTCRLINPLLICYYKYKPPLCLKPPSKSVFKTHFELNTFAPYLHRNAYSLCGHFECFSSWLQIGQFHDEHLGAERDYNDEITSA